MDAEASCYNKAPSEEWTQVVQFINELSVHVFPKILLTQNGAWSGVVEDFPRVSYDTQICVKGIKAYEFIDEHQNDIDLTKLEAAPREERSSLEIYQLTKGLMKIIIQRIKVYKQYQQVLDDSQQLLKNEYNNNVLYNKIKLQNADKEERAIITCELMRKYESYDKACTKFKESCVIFESLSNNLIATENHKNKNAYLNFEVFKGMFAIGGKNHKEYLDEQNSLFNSLLKYIFAIGGTATPEAPETERDQPKNENKMLKFQHELAQYKEDINYIDLEICTSTLTQLKRYLREVEDINNSLQSYVKDEQLKDKISSEDKLYIRNIRKTIDNLDTQIEEKEADKLKEAEQHRADAQANIKSLKAVNLTPLTGFDDYLSWRKSQKVLNTHTSPFKKAQALINTLKNQDDIEMCQGIYDYDVLMSMLEDKYAHADMIIPKMLQKLKNLPNGTSNEIMLKNISIIINIYEQIKSVGKEALNMFDQTVIDQMKCKLTFSCQTRYARYKILKSEDRVEPEHLSEDEDKFSVMSGVSRLEKPKEAIDELTKRRLEFIKFIKIESRALNETLTRNDTGAKPKKCLKCKNVLAQCKCKGNKKREDAYNVQHTTEKKKACPVPNCGATTPHLNRYQKPTSSLGRCPKFKEMKYEDRQKLAFKLKACFVCLSIGHAKEDCKIKTNCYNCDKDRHHPLLCKQPSKFSNSNEEANSAEDTDARVLLLATEGEVLYEKAKNDNSSTRKSRSTNILFDGGATCNFVLNKLALELGYIGKPTELNLSKVGSSKSKEQANTKQYMIQILNNKNETCSIKCYGVDGWEKIASDRVPLNQRILKDVSKRFGVPSAEMNNVSGEVGLLIGARNLTYHPKRIKDNGDLVLFKSMFGKRYVLGGQVDGNSAQNTHHTAYHVEISNQSYWTGDQLGLNTDPKCSTCLKAPPCNQCKLLNHPITFKEQEEGKIIRNSMEFDLKKGEIRVSYPYMKTIDEKFSPQHSNKFIAEKMAQNLRRSLTKDGLLKTYTENFLDMESRGAIRELTNEEMTEWEANGNPINYCSHHAVLKDSKSTACRSVCNSSLKHNGTTLNLMLPKGPKALSNLLHVLMRFRSKPYVVICDLKKAYNSIKTSVKDCHLILNFPPILYSILFAISFFAKLFMIFIKYLK